MNQCRFSRTHCLITSQLFFVSIITILANNSIITSGNELVTEQRDKFRSLITETMKFVYDLHSPESNIRLTETPLFYRLMRPRLPIEVHFLLYLKKFGACRQDWKTFITLSEAISNLNTQKKSWFTKVFVMFIIIWLE